MGGEHSYHVTVLDFGVSKVLDSTTLVTQGDFVVGTPQYMAPEQASGEKEIISAKSDQFSMACVFYEMMCGQKAFVGGTLAEVVYQVCHKDPPSLIERNPDIPIAISQAVERAMSKENTDRFANVLDFVNALHGREVDEAMEVESLDFDDSDRAPVDPLADTVAGNRFSAATRISEAEASPTVRERDTGSVSDKVEREPIKEEGGGEVESGRTRCSSFVGWLACRLCHVLPRFVR